MSRYFRHRVTAAIMGAVAVVAAATSPAFSTKPASERRIALYNIHNGETIDIVYKRDGKWVPGAKEQIDWFLRDWRRNEPTKIDPELIDIVWELRTELGTRVPTHVISGYRAPATNNMLRRTSGGQAKKSLHTLGKAMDIHFPDVSAKQLRYSALIRERGGVGYYPTSAIPFVHVDTGRVRHWPRMPRYELALLFPDGRSQHTPSDGRPLTKSDVQIARVKHQDVARQIAEFQELRKSPKAPSPTLVADGWRADVRRQVAMAGEPVAKPKPEPAQSEGLRIASLTPIVPPQPRAAERPSRAAQPDEADRRKLTDLFAMASLLPMPAAFSGPPKPVTATGPAAGRPEGAPQVAGTEPSALGENAAAAPTPSTLLGSIKDLISLFVAAPEYDEEHPDELYYRPFPLGPLLTATPSSDDPALARMQEPDVAATLDLLSDELEAAPPMRFTPTSQLARAMWSGQFTPGLAASDVPPPQPAEASPIGSRAVRTSMR